MIFEALKLKTGPCDTLCKKCPTCALCRTHRKCRCVRCVQCGKLRRRRDICLRRDANERACVRCKDHHIDILPARADFPFRPCQYKIEGEFPAITTFTQNPLTRSIGVELECEYWTNTVHGQPDGYNLYGAPATIQWEHDGSVKPSKLELVTGPMMGDDFHKTLDHILPQMKKFEAKAGRSAGFHVHVDAVRLTARELRRVLFVWALLEHQIFGTLVSAHRGTNIFCAPVSGGLRINRWWKEGQTETDIMTQFYQYLYGLTIPPRTDPSWLETMRMVKRQLIDLKRHKYENAARRRAINFHSWMMRGTIEFRCFEGTTDPTDITNWPLWCAWLVEKCVTSITDEEVAAWLANQTVKTPTLLDLSKRFAEGSKTRTRMPSSVVEWVEAKCKKRIATTTI